jgi:hypothetical protein
LNARDSLVSNSPQGAPSLVVTGGPLDGQALALKRGAEQVLGSGSQCDLRLELGNIDPVHARITWDARGARLSDAGTTTGTYVNGEKIGAAHALQSGDRVFLGPPGSKQSAKLLVVVPEGVTIAPDEDLVLEAEEAPVLFQAEASEPLVLDEPRAPTPPPRAAPAPPPPAPPARPAPPPPPVRPAAAVPAPPAAAPAPPPRKAEKADYQTELPSIAPADHKREAPLVPPAAPGAMPRPKAARPRPPVPTVSRPILIGVGAGVVGLAGVFGAYKLLYTPPPVIQSVAPPRVEPGGTLSVTGSGLSANVVVRIGDHTGKVVSATDTSLSVTLPEMPVRDGVMDVPVLVESRGGRSNSLFVKVYAAPRIASLTPDVAMPGDEVTATGQNLEGSAVVVQVAEQPAKVLGAQGGSLRFRVPALPIVEPGRPVPVTVTVGGETGKPATLLLGRLPLLVGVAPVRGHAGTRVKLEGRGFDPSVQDNAVSFGTQQALVVQAQPRELVVLAPAIGIETNTLAPVVVRVQGRPTAGEHSFTVTRPPSSTYIPRFFAAGTPEHAGHDHVFVATELGPVLLLAGPGDAPSTLERAERAAAALNAAFEAAAGGKVVAVEVQGAALRVGAAVTSASPADAAAYDESWEGVPRGARATPERLAAFWGAIVEDHLRLFVQRQRPMRLLELSPRGRALSDVYAEAARRGPFSGVAPGLVAGSAGLMRAYREMTLAFPGEARAAAAVEGSWSGTVEDQSGQRQVRLVLRVDSGGRLSGTITIGSGQVAMGVPLKEAAYDKGTLRFVAASGGAARHFVGRVEGDTVSGTVHASASAQDAIGRFTLRYTQ